MRSSATPVTALAERTALLSLRLLATAHVLFLLAFLAGLVAAAGQG